MIAVTRPATATITAVDREAGTITFSQALKSHWEPDTLFMHPRMYEALAGVLKVLKEEYSEGIFPDGLFGVTRTADPARLAGCRIGRAQVGTLSAPAVVALTTLCAMEWLRHRKQAVAAAEQSGDYSSLIEEFVAWLRALFAEWRAALTGTPQ